MKITRKILYSLLLGTLIQGTSAMAQITSGMALIPPGSFTIGDSQDGESDAIPTGTVTLNGFYMDTNLTSSNSWASLLQWAVTNGYAFDETGYAVGSDYPIDYIDWYDTIKWCNARSQKAGLTPVYYTNAALTAVYKTGENTNVYVNWTNIGYRLPTEAEWEVAARGGLTGDRFPWGNTINSNQANYTGDPYNGTTGYAYDLSSGAPNMWDTNTSYPASLQGNSSPVGYYPPNAYGINDMAGNEFEWCWDWYSNSYAAFPLTNPHGPTGGTNRVARGGAWNQYAYDSRAAFRGFQLPGTGNQDDVHSFRSVLPVYAAVIVEANPTNEGVVTGGGATFSAGTVLTNTATPNNGYEFVNWTSNDVIVSTSTNYVLTVNSNDVLVANFATAEYTITVTPSPIAGGTVSGGGVLLVSNTATVLATPNTGYTFTEWTTNGVQASTSNSYSFTVLNNESLTAVFTPIDYTITTSANPGADGSVSGASGSIPYGTLETNFATANAGFQFVDWTVNSVVVGTVTNYTYTVTTNETLVANFVPITYLVTVIANPVADGTVANVSGTYPVGNLVTNTATANTGYIFVNWTSNGTPVSTSTNYVLTVNTNVALIANFAPTNFTITVTVSPVSASAAILGGTFPGGSSATLIATPNAGYAFLDWTLNGNVVSSMTNYTFTVTSNEALVANFTNTEVAITVFANPNSGGTVSNGGGEFPIGSQVTNTAVASNGFVFFDWTTNGILASTNATDTFTVFTNEVLIANFLAVSNNFTVIAYADTGGTVSNAGGTFSAGSSVTNTAAANAGFQFFDWTINGAFASSTATYSFTVFTNVALVANFTNTNNVVTNYVSLIAYAGAGGTVANAGGTFPTGSSVTNTATASNGYQFANWTTNGSVATNTTNYSFILDTNVALVANFTNTNTVVTNYVSLIAYAGDGGTVANAGGTFPVGSSVTNTATASNNYQFANWTTNGIVATNTTNYSFTLDTNVALVANFIANAADDVLTVIPYPVNGGIVSPGGSFPPGSLVTNSATASNGFVFLNWMTNGILASTSNSYVLTLNSNETLVANFAPVPYTVTATSSPSAANSTASLGGTFPAGSSATVMVTPNPGFQFLDWTENSSIVSTSNVFNFTVASNETLVANFTTSTANLVSYTNFTAIGSGVSLTVLTSGAGTVSPNLSGEALTMGKSYALTATADGGYLFAGWTGAVTTNQNPLSITLTSNVTLQANFVSDLFLPSQGTYNGLFVTTNGVTEPTAGMLKGLTVSQKGTYSGTVLFGGGSYAIKGNFSATGLATNQISPKSGVAGPLTLVMSLSISNDEPMVTGTVANGSSWVANLTAYYASAGEFSGQYTMLIPPGTNNPPTSSPGGDGYALIADAKGVAKLTGALADGTTFSQSTTVSQGGYVPIYSSLYGNKGLLLGWVNLASTNASNVSLTWIHPVLTSGLYTNGFTNVLLTNQIALSPWTNPPAQGNLPPAFSMVGTINGSNAVTATLATTSAGKVSGTASSGAAVTGTISLKTGLLTVTIGSGTSKVTGYGAILLNATNGGGYFVTKTNAQAIQLSP